MYVWEGMKNFAIKIMESIFINGKELTYIGKTPDEKSSKKSSQEMSDPNSCLRAMNSLVAL